jgi:hypothetical protein
MVNSILVCAVGKRYMPMEVTAKKCAYVIAVSSLRIPWVHPNIWGTWPARFG